MALFCAERVVCPWPDPSLCRISFLLMQLRDAHGIQLVYPEVMWAAHWMFKYLNIITTVVRASALDGTSSRWDVGVPSLWQGSPAIPSVASMEKGA